MKVLSYVAATLLLLRCLTYVRCVTVSRNGSAATILTHQCMFGPVEVCPGVTKFAGETCALKCFCQEERTCSCDKYSGVCHCLDGWEGPECNEKSYYWFKWYDYFGLTSAAMFLICIPLYVWFYFYGRLVRQRTKDNAIRKELEETYSASRKVPYHVSASNAPSVIGEPVNWRSGASQISSRPPSVGTTNSRLSSARNAGNAPSQVSKQSKESLSSRYRDLKTKTQPKLEETDEEMLHGEANGIKETALDSETPRRTPGSGSESYTESGSSYTGSTRTSERSGSISGSRTPSFTGSETGSEYSESLTATESSRSRSVAGADVHTSIEHTSEPDYDPRGGSIKSDDPLIGDSPVKPTTHLLSSAAPMTKEPPLASNPPVAVEPVSKGSSYRNRYRGAESKPAYQPVPTQITATPTPVQPPSKPQHWNQAHVPPSQVPFQSPSVVPQTSVPLHQVPVQSGNSGKGEGGRVFRKNPEVEPYRVSGGSLETDGTSQGTGVSNPQQVNGKKKRRRAKSPSPQVSGGFMVVDPTSVLTGNVVPLVQNEGKGQKSQKGQVRKKRESEVDEVFERPKSAAGYNRGNLPMQRGMGGGMLNSSRSSLKGHAKYSDL